MKKMKWIGIEKFLGKYGELMGSLAGYVQKWNNLSHFMVMNARNLVPTDEAMNSQAMMEWKVRFWREECLQVKYYLPNLTLLFDRRQYI